MQKSEKGKFIHSFITERTVLEKIIIIILSTTDKIILIFNNTILKKICSLTQQLVVTFIHLINFYRYVKTF